MKIHIAKTGDTLFSIAKKYGVKYEKLVEANAHIEDPHKLLFGTKVKVPSTGINLQPISRTQESRLDREDVREFEFQPYSPLPKWSGPKLDRYYPLQNLESVESEKDERSESQAITPSIEQIPGPQTMQAEASPETEGIPVPPSPPGILPGLTLEPDMPPVNEDLFAIEENELAEFYAQQQQQQQPQQYQSPQMPQQYLQQMPQVQMQPDVFPQTPFMQAPFLQMPFQMPYPMPYQTPYEMPYQSPYQMPFQTPFLQMPPSQQSPYTELPAPIIPPYGMGSHYGLLYNNPIEGMQGAVSPTPFLQMDQWHSWRDED